MDTTERETLARVAGQDWKTHGREVTQIPGMKKDFFLFLSFPSFSFRFFHFLLFSFFYFLFLLFLYIDFSFQRKYFLNEQMKSIRKELGMEQDEKETLVTKFKDRLKSVTVYTSQREQEEEREMKKILTCLTAIRRCTKTRHG